MRRQAALVLFLVSACLAHICVIHPHQRGDMDISWAGSHTCVKPRSPCGGAAPGDLVTPLQPGPNQLQLQQNLNHYTIGNSGIIDISISYLENPTKDEDFQVLDKISDYYAYRQFTQTNYSLTVNLPQQECTRCVLRFRYLPNKPTEPVFHQCSDISIKKQDTLRVSNAPFGKIYALRYNKATDDVATLVEIDPNTSTLTELTKLDGLVVRGVYHPNVAVKAQVHQFHNRRVMANFKPNIANQIVAADPATSTIYYIMSQGSEAIPNHLIYFVAGKEPFYHVISVQLAPQQVVTGLNWDAKNKQLLAITFKPADAGTFQFQVNKLDTATGQLTVLASFEPDDTFVDFLTSNLDSTNRVLHVLLRDENSDKMNQKLFSANIDTGKTAVVQLDAAYSFSDFVYSRYYNSLISTSIGAADPKGVDETLNYFDLIRVNTTSGTQQKLYTMNDEKKNSYYGGNVWSGYEDSQRTFFHVFRNNGMSELRSVSVVARVWKVITSWKHVESDLYNVIYMGTQ